MAIFNSYIKLPEGIYVGNPSKLQDLELLQNLEPQKLVAFSVASELPKHLEKCLDLKFPSLGRPCRLSLFTLDSAIGSPIWSSFMVVLVRQRYPTNLYRITLHISICAYIYIHTYIMYLYIYVFIYVYIYIMYTSDDVAMVKRMRVSPWRTIGLRPSQPEVYGIRCTTLKISYANTQTRDFLSFFACLPEGIP